MLSLWDLRGFKIFFTIALFQKYKLKIEYNILIVKLIIISNRYKILIHLNLLKIILLKIIVMFLNKLLQV